MDENTNVVARKEWVAIFRHGANEVKIAYRNPLALARGLSEQTSQDWFAVKVYERDAETYTGNE